MDSRSKLKYSNFPTVLKIISIVLLVHITSANTIDQNSSNDSIQLQIIQNTVDQYAAVLLQPNHVYSNRYKRSITTSSTPTSKSNRLLTIENQLIKLQKQLSDFTTRSSLSNEDYLRIKEIQTTVTELSVMLENLQNEYAENNQRIQNITQKLEKTAIFTIVQSINASQFSFADEHLQGFTDDSIYKKIVQQVYLQHADTFNLLITFGGSITDLERKFKVYQALYNVVRTNSSPDIQKLLQLSQSIRKGVYEVSFGSSLEDNSRSLIRTLWKENEEPTSTLFSATLVKNESKNWSTIKQLNDEIRKSSGFKFFGHIYNEAIEKIWGTTSIGQILFVSHQSTTMAEERIIIHECIFRKLQGDGKLYTDNVIPLVRYMKATWEDPGLNSVDWQSRYKFIINKLPSSLRNIVLQSIVCIKYSHFNEYLYAEDSSEERVFRDHRSVYTWIPKGKHNSPEFKWKLSFGDDNLFRIFNVKYYTESLHMQYYVNSKNETRYLTSERRDQGWHFHVDGESVQISRFVDNLYLHAGEKQNDYRHYVVAHNRTSKPPNPLKWDFTDCSECS